jgi:hydrogenase small subunit
VIEGSIPNENINGDGYWTSFGNDPATGEPLTLNWWIDRLAPRAWAVVGAGTCATYGGIHAMAGNPTGCMGLWITWGGTSALVRNPDRQCARVSRAAR